MPFIVNLLIFPMFLKKLYQKNIIGMKIAFLYTSGKITGQFGTYALSF